MVCRIILKKLFDKCFYCDIVVLTKGNSMKYTTYEKIYRRWNEKGADMAFRWAFNDVYRHLTKARYYADKYGRNDCHTLYSLREMMMAFYRYKVNLCDFLGKDTEPYVEKLTAIQLNQSSRGFAK